MGLPTPPKSPTVFGMPDGEIGDRSVTRRVPPGSARSGHIGIRRLHDGPHEILSRMHFSLISVGGSGPHRRTVWWHEAR